MAIHSVPIEKCDVADKERMAVYRYFRANWIEMLNGEDEHGIAKQITALLDMDLQFRTINHSRLLNEKAGIAQNGMLHSIIDHGFFLHQVFAIRRLTEEFRGLKHMAVYSLHRVISEIQEQTELVTREMYVCADGDPYEPGTGLSRSRNRHEVFDELSQTMEEVDRSRNDQIHEDYFDEQKALLKSSKKFKSYANKFLAHAADPVTRKQHFAGFSLDDFDAVYKDLSHLTNNLSTKMLYSSSHVFKPCYAYDALENIDSAVCPTDQIEELRGFLEEREAELEGYGSDSEGIK